MHNNMKDFPNKKVSDCLWDSVRILYFYARKYIMVCMYLEKYNSKIGLNFLTTEHVENGYLLYSSGYLMTGITPEMHIHRHINV